MKENRWTMMWAAGLVATAALVGCESASDERSVLRIDPPSADVVGEGSVRFTAIVDTNQTVVLPLEWTVDDPSLGRISSSGGLSAVYVADDHAGVNTISVRDQLDQSTVAVVNQTEAPEEP